MNQPSFSLSEDELLLNPICRINFYEFLGPWPAAQAQPEWAAFSFKPQCDVKKRAALPLLDCPFREQGIRSLISRKLEFIAIVEFTDALSQVAQFRSELF